MKALTLRHPWAFAVCHWGKRIENRTWKPPASLVGQRFAIHGGKCPTSSGGLAEVKSIFDDLLTIHGKPDYRINGDLKLRDVILEGIVATAVVDRYIYLDAFPGKIGDPALQDPWFDDEVPSNIGWVLRDVVVLPEPIPCKGAQGLWTVPNEIVSQIQGVSA